MTFTEIFTAYYTQYRADADVPTSTDDEYTIGLRLANEAISYWENYDNTFWKELYDTNQNDGSGTQTITTGTIAYDAPDNFREAGGFVTVKSATGAVVQNYPIIEPHEAQFQGQDAVYCYFTGDPSNGYTLNLNPAPTSALNGLDIDYVYYKTATLFTTGSDVSEMPNPYFIVHRILANQFRASRNPYYTAAKGDAENAMKVMQMHNNSGTWANPWNMSDTSGTSWGQ